MWESCVVNLYAKITVLVRVELTLDFLNKISYLSHRDRKNVIGRNFFIKNGQSSFQVEIGYR